MNATAPPKTRFHLSPAEVKRYHLEGYLGPFDMCTTEQMAASRESIDALLAPADQDELPSMIQRLNLDMQRGFGRHHDSRLLFDMATDPTLVDRVTSILGNDLLLWRTMFFNKQPGAPRIPWHQDYDDWPVEPYLVMSAWIAVDPATLDNGCVEIIPGSHRRFIPLVESTDDVSDGFDNMADPKRFDDSNALAMQLQPGQFFIFNERLLHRSAANISGVRRLGLAVRFILPLVRILDSGDHAILVSGKDRFGYNELVEPPSA